MAKNISLFSYVNALSIIYVNFVRFGSRRQLGVRAGGAAAGRPRPIEAPSKAKYMIWKCFSQFVVPILYSESSYYLRI